MRRFITPLRLAAVGLVLFVVAVVILLTRNSDAFLLVPDRAHPLAGLVKVPGGKPPDKRGGIYYVDVVERRASLLERMFPGLRNGATLVKHSQITPPGVTDAQRIRADQLDMRLSQQVATAVALKVLGYRVQIRADGVRVALVYGNTHAVGRLHVDDVIVGADGKPVHTTTELHEILSHHHVGDLARIVYVRDGIRHTVRITTSNDPFDPGRAIIGIQPQPALDLRVPFTIRFDLGSVGGPSAGLAFALEILEQRGRDVDNGYRVAATGVIGPDGEVGAIGGIEQKTIGAREAHVDVFLVPAGENYHDALKYAHGLRIVAVQTFQQALRALATLPPKG